MENQGEILRGKLSGLGGFPMDLFPHEPAGFLEREGSFGTGCRFLTQNPSIP
jgi:hypothetical protein